MTDEQEPTNAQTFGRVFEFLAKRLLTAKDRSRALKAAEVVWTMIDRFDFTPQEMQADAHLVNLGLAHECPDCQTIVYHKAHHDCLER